MLRRHLGESSRYDLGVDESGLEQRRHEVLIFLAKGAQLRDAQVLLVETPSGVLRLARRRRGVRVLDSDQPVAPTMWQDGSLQVYTVNAEAVLFLERRPLARDTFDHVGKSSGFIAVVAERENIDLYRHSGFRRKFVLGEGSEDGLGARQRLQLHVR